MDQKRLILAAFLSMLVLLAWGVLFSPPEQGRREVGPLPPAGDAVPAAPEESRVAVSPTTPLEDAPSPRDDEEAAEETPLEDITEREVEIESDAVVARFTNRGAQLVSLRLKGTTGRDGDPLEMVRRRSEGPFPFALLDRQGRSIGVNDALFVVEGPGESSDDGGEASLRFRYNGSAGSVVKDFRFQPNGLFEVDIEARRTGEWGLLLGPGLRNPSTKELESRFQMRAASYWVGTGLEQSAAGKTPRPIAIPGQGLRWVALEDTYFITMLAPKTAVETAVVEPMLYRVGSDRSLPSFLPMPANGELSAEQEALPQELRLVVQPGGQRLQATAFWGAKNYRQLASLPFDLERTIRWGFFGVLARPMLFGLIWIHDNIAANFGWSIVLLTVLIKIVLFPLTHKSFVSMQKMQRLSPKIEAIKQKYRGKRDKQGRPNVESQRQMNQEMQELFREEGVNPAGGCLPILLQMPVFFAFFTLLRNSVELWNAPWTLWIQDLSAPDPFYALPIIMGAAQFLQQRMTPVTNANPGQRVLLTTMPIWFTIISFGFASGLVLYWLTNNVLTIVQQSIYQRLKKAGYLGGEETPAPAKASAKRGDARKERARRGGKR